MVDRLDDFFLGVRPVFHERAAHARHRRILVGLAPARAGRLQLVLLRADLVVQVRLQDAVLDHDRAAGLVALVVVIQRAAFTRNGRLVDDRDKRFRNFLADHVGVDARALAVEVGLHTVADCLVQQDAACARCQDNWHLTRRWPTRIKQDHGAVDGFLDHPVETLLGVPAELLARRDVRIARLHFFALARGNKHRYPRHRPMVGDELAVKRCDHNALVAVTPIHGNLFNRGVLGFGFLLDVLQYG